MNGVIIVNKEKDMTSRDVVNKLCKLLGTKKIGHTGTLDPIATGVLVCCVGNCTKLVELLTSTDKEYIANIKFGVSTDTLDVTGEVICTSDISFNESDLLNTLKKYTGKYMQEVPKYSAVSINGKRLYEYARNNIEVELPKREVNITKLELISFDGANAVIRCVVSKGTYIRSLIKDICDDLNSCGTMEELQRVKQGVFDISESYTLDDIANSEYKLFGLSEILSDMQTIDLDEEIYNRVKNGAIIDRNFDCEMAVYKYNDEVVAIYKVYDKDTTLVKPYKMF